LKRIKPNSKNIGNQTKVIIFFSLQKAVELGLISEKKAKEIYEKDGEVWIANMRNWFG